MHFIRIQKWMKEKREYKIIDISNLHKEKWQKLKFQSELDKTFQKVKE